MRIVHVYKDYHPPVRGGVEQTIERMARWQVAAGHEVTVLVSASGERTGRTDVIHGVRVVRVAERARLLSSPLCPGFPAALAAEQADLWHLHSPNPLGEASWRSVRPRGALVITYHCDLLRQRALLPLYRPLVRSLFRRADVLHTTSRQALERRSSLMWPFRERFRVVPLGVDPDPLLSLDGSRPGAQRLRERYGDPFVLFVGRLRYYKGLDVLLEAVPRIGATLVIVGEGPMGGPLRAQAERLGLNGRVHFTGSVSDEVLHDHLAAAAVGILPSSGPAEAFGLAMVEYLAAGLPVVSTELGTGTSFVNQDGVTGVIVRPCDPGALSDGLRRLLADRETRERMGRAGRNRVQEHFTTASMMRGMEELYADALASASRRSRP
jgi:rhamnosyl/mannosyltransferase